MFFSYLWSNIRKILIKHICYSRSVTDNTTIAIKLHWIFALKARFSHDFMHNFLAKSHDFKQNFPSATDVAPLL